MNKKIKQEQDRETEENKIANYMDSVKHKESNNTCVKTPELDNQHQEVNPFFKQVNRHYGSFKVKILGNYKARFNSLPFSLLKPWGRNKNGCQRKKWQTKTFTALFYSNGTLEIKPVSKRGLSPFELQADFFCKARYCLKLLESYGVQCSGLKLNRRPKYGFEDKAARMVKGEFHGKNRGIDGSPGHQHLDAFSAEACVRDLRCSDDEHVVLARARVENPELFADLHAKMDFLADTNVKFAENIRLHLNVLEEQKKALRAIARGLNPRVPRLPSRKDSTTLRGVS